MSPIFRTASFLASCLATIMCIFTAFVCLEMKDRSAAVQWLGWGGVWALAVLVHWALDRQYGGKRP